MTKVVSNIPLGAHDILRTYAKSPHYSNDLMIGTANRVEKALEQAGVKISGSGFRAGVLTRLYSRNEVGRFPDSNFKYLRDPDIFRREVVERGATVGGIHRLMYAEELGPLCGNDADKITDKHIRDIHRTRIAQLVGRTEDEIRNGYIQRLLDKPEICDLLIQYFNEHKIAEFQSKLSQSPFYRAGKHRLLETKNQAKHHKPATLGSYIARTFCPEEIPSVESRGKTSKDKREAVLTERDNLLAQIPIDPDRISDDSLVKMGLAPDDFTTTYTLQARRRYRMAVSDAFLQLLTHAKMIHRPQGTKRSWQEKPTTARIISFIGADGEEKIGIFSTVTESHTKEVKSGEETKNKHQRVSDTTLKIFAGREEARRSQEHAVGGMKEKHEIYKELLANLDQYRGKERDEKQKFLETIISDALRKINKKKSYHDDNIKRYLDGSSEGKPTVSVLQDPSLIGPLKKQLRQGIHELEAKMQELEIIKDMIQIISQ